MRVVPNIKDGSLLNAGSRFFDQRLGQSTTLSGRSVTCHMAAKTNEYITGEYSHYGDAITYGDTDSFVASTLHHSSNGHLTIETLFNGCTEFWNDGDKEYAYDPELTVMSYNEDMNEPYMSHIEYIYRHKVSKDLYEVEDELGNVITVTQDHSVMVERDGKLISVKPAEITDTDGLVSIVVVEGTETSGIKLEELLTRLLLDPIEQTAEIYKQVKAQLKGYRPSKKISLHKATVKAVRKLRTAENEYVYDIGMKNTRKPWFFGNNILLHNSCYFSAYPSLKKDIAAGDVDWSKDAQINLYNEIAKSVSSTFPEFLNKTFNVPIERSTGVIASSRETVSESGLFITKKRYAVLMFDKDGFRLDTNGKPGKLKAMGLDLKRADTPKFVQQFLYGILHDTLTDKGEEYIIKQIKEFKAHFESLKPWQKGTPRAVNRISYYQKREEEYIQIKMSGRKPPQLTVPGHVRASINWNHLREINGDQHAPRILDGQKIVVCALKEDATNRIKSIAYPVDITHMPDWFLSLPFADEDMMVAIVDQKVKNLLGVLNWSLERTQKSHEHLETLFDFTKI